jgi:hypothetical protein
MMNRCWRRNFWELRAEWNKGNSMHRKRRETSMTKDKGSSIPRNKEVKSTMKTNHTKGSWNVGKWIPLRVRVFVNVRVFTHFL